MPGRPSSSAQNSGAVTASEKFSASDSSAARATPASSSALRIAADDTLHGVTAACQAGVIQAARDRGNVPIEAVLGDQRAHEHGIGHPAERDQAQQCHRSPTRS